MNLLSTTFYLGLLFTANAFVINKSCFARNLISGVAMSTVEAPLVSQVFIGNLPFEMDEDALKALIAERGTLYKSLRLAIDKRTGKSRGFGYLDFDEKEQAETAITSLAGFQVEGRDVKIDISEPRADRGPRVVRAPQEHSVYVGNLDFTVTEEQIMEMCNDLLGPGVASKARILIDRDTGT